MKKLYTLLFIALTAASASAQVADAFTGTGTLISNGWTTHSGTTPGQVSIVTGSLTYTGLTSTGNKTQTVSGNTEDVSLLSPAAITGTGYYSALINFPNTTGLTANTATGDYSLMFGTLSTGGTPTLSVFTARIYFREGSVANTVNIGVLNASGGTAAPSFSTVDYPVNTTHFVVVKYVLATNTASLWIDPAIGGTEGTPTVTNATGTTAAPAQLERLAIRQGTSTGNMLIDEVRMGTTWAYVTSATLGVKSNNIAGLNIYPNPVTNGTLFINTDANAERNVTVFDVLGKQVLKVTTSNNAINVANLNAGVYIVKVTEEGKTATRKLVIR